MPYCTRCGAEFDGPLCAQCGASAENGETTVAEQDAQNVVPCDTENKAKKKRSFIWKALLAWPTCMMRSFKLRGRASRTEFWGFILPNVFMYFFFMFLFWAIFEVERRSVYGTYKMYIWSGYARFFYFLAIIPATFCVTVRRLHDSDLSAIWVLPFVLLHFIRVVFRVVTHDFVIAVVMPLFFFCVYLTLRGSTPGPNRFGEDTDDL